MPTGRLREKVIVTRQIIDLHALPAGPDPLSLAAGDGKIKQRPIVGPFQRPVQRSPQNPTRIAVLMDVADMDAVMAAMQTEAAAKVMAYDGVLADSLVILVEA